LKHKYTRANISPNKEKFMNLDEAIKMIKGRKITLREAGEEEIASHQSLNRCNCKIGCETKNVLGMQQKCCAVQNVMVTKTVQINNL
jgi:hypothetical protein